MFTMNGILWKIRYVSPNSPFLRRSNGTYTFGMCDGSRNEIYLSNALYGSFLRKVLIHEVCHSAVFSYGIEMDLEQEELLCEFVANYADEIFEAVDGAFSAMKNAV